ncbi:MAG TPA: response regulator transcription factor [Thermoleophilaceae bacterium]|jgi:DNA-binding response OmpR family regulator
MQRDSILIYAGDEELLAKVGERLRLDGYEAHVARARDQFLWALRERRPTAVVVGEVPTLPATLALLRELRRDEAGADPNVPVLLLSGAAGELAELAAFDAGADDFQPASVTYLRLRARLRALVARSRITRRAQHIQVGSIRIDAIRRQVTCAGCALPLSTTEFALLHELAREPQRVFTTRELLERVWGWPSDAGARTRRVTAHAVRLRRKLADAGITGAIENCRGHGYRLGLIEHDPAPAA